MCKALTRYTEMVAFGELMANTQHRFIMAQIVPFLREAEVSGIAL